MNRKQRETLLRIFEQPTPSTLRWVEVEALLRALGAETAEGSGSRVRVALGNTRAVFHRPHPSPELKRASVRSVRDFLVAAGAEPTEMGRMLEYKGYVGTVEVDDGVLFGRVAGLRDVITFEGRTVEEVQAAFRDSVDDYLAFCTGRGETPEVPFNGEIALRVDPELHRRAVTRAQAAGMSLNEWISRRLLETA